MADFPIANDYQFSESFGYNLGSGTGTSFTSTGSGVSTWTELILSTADDIDLIELFFLRGTSGALMEARIDIGIGGFGSEQVLIEGLLLDGKPSSTGLTDLKWEFPIPIPSGTRIAFRGEFGSSNREVIFAGNLFTGTLTSPQSYSSLKSFGFDGRGGISVDPGGTINAKGVWEEIIASTSDEIQAFYVGIGSNANGAQGFMNCYFDISLGSFGNEDDAIIAQNIPFDASTGEKIRYHPFVDRKIPVGSRVAIRMQSTIDNATDRLASFTIEGFL